MLGHGDAGDFSFLGHYKACWISYNLTPFHDDTDAEQLYAHSPIKWIIAEGRAYMPSQHTHAQMEACCWHILIRLFVSLISPLSQAISALLLHKHTQIESRRSIWGEVPAALPPETCTSSGDQLKKHRTRFFRV